MIYPASARVGVRPTRAVDEFEEMRRRLREASHEALAAAPLVERWFVDRSLGKPCLVGFVSGHPEIVDGRCVRTSLLLRIAPEAGWARTRNRFYRLGRSLDEWRARQ